MKHAAHRSLSDGGCMLVNGLPLDTARCLSAERERSVTGVRFWVYEAEDGCEGLVVFGEG